MLTGNKDLDTTILNNLEDRDLINYCQTNKSAEALCDDQSFWLQRIMSKFPYLGLDILNKYKNNQLWSEYYIKDLRKVALSNNMNNTLFNASKLGRLDHVMIAINNGADIHYRSDYAIMSASRHGHIDVIRYLVNQGANIHVWDDGPFRSASQYGYIDMVRYLVSKGANIHAHDDYAIRWATKNGHLDVVD